MRGVFQQLAGRGEIKSVRNLQTKGCVIERHAACLVQHADHRVNSFGRCGVLGSDDWAGPYPALPMIGWQLRRQTAALLRPFIIPANFSDTIPNRPPITSDRLTQISGFARLISVGDAPDNSPYPAVEA